MSVISKVREVLDSDAAYAIVYDPPLEESRDGSFVDHKESSLHPHLLKYLASSFPSGLFRHQHNAVEEVLRGVNTVVATRTSSGKSLIYSLPVFDAIVRDGNSTSMFLFPQKALANDQQLKLREMSARIETIDDLAKENALLISRYDGSIPQDQRKLIRDKTQVLLTNPDMLHLGILQHHQTYWQRFFSRLRLVAIDECHEYRGVFGTNVAYILRRLRQLCYHCGSKPVFVATSATVQAPEEHMRHLTGLDFRCIGPEQDTSKQGSRKFWIVASQDHYYDTGRKLAKSLSEAGLTVLVFCPSRLSAERMIARTVTPDDLDSSYVRVYRSGLSATQREEIERGLRSRSVRLVFSTSALELGIDIGEIDVVLCVGLPHTMMSMWQRAGRSARGGREGAAILIPADTPIDTYYASHPDELFARENEPLILNLQNRRISCQHYACAVQECGGDEASIDTDILGAEIASVQELRAAGKLNNDIFYCTDPHIEVNIRSGGERSFRLIVDDEEIGEIDHYHLLRECYTNAIYRHGGRAYRVLNVLYGRKLIRLRREYTRNETRPQLQRKIRLKNQFRVADYDDFRVATAALDVTEFLVSVTEKDPAGNRIMVWPGSSGMRQYRLPTEGTMLAFSRSFWSDMSDKLGLNPHAALLAVERLLASLFPTTSGPCDTQDYSSGIDRLATNENALFLYDTVYDGAGLTTVAFDHISDLVGKAIDRLNSCACTTDEGCLQCIANPLADERVSKMAARTLLISIHEVLMNKDPILREIAQDFDASLLDGAVTECATCGHRLPSGSKFCSECGTKVEV